MKYIIQDKMLLVNLNNIVLSSHKLENYIRIMVAIIYYYNDKLRIFLLYR